MRRSARVLSQNAQHCLGVLERHFSPAVPRAPKGNNIVVEHARGCWITDVHGRKYLDFQTGIGVASTGHCHPRLVRLGWAHRGGRGVQRRARAQRARARRTRNRAPGGSVAARRGERASPWTAAES